MKRLFTCLIAAAIGLTLLACPAFAALPAGTGDGFYAVDNANVLSAETEELLVEYNDVLENQCRNAQLVVATVTYLDEDADVYATRLLNDWGVGSADESNGALILLVTEEYRGGVTVGDGLDEAFYDGFNESYYDDFWDDVDKDRFDDAVRTLAGHIYDWYLDYYDVEPVAEEPVNNGGSYGYGYDYDYAQPQPVSRGPSIIGIVVLILLALAVFWVIGAASRFARMSRWGYTGGFMPIFLPGGRRRYREWYRRQPPPPPPGGGFGPGPGPGPGPGSFRSSPPRRSSFTSSSRPRSGGFGGSSRPSGGTRGGGFGGHGGGGFRGRR